MIQYEILLVKTVMKRSSLLLLLLVAAAVLSSGCPLLKTPLDDIPPHITQANNALTGLNIIEGKSNTFALDDEIMEIDLLFVEMEEIEVAEDDEETIARYAAYRTWTESLRTASRIISNDYDSYQTHLRRAEQQYDAFNYILYRDEMNKAEKLLQQMEDDALSAAYSLDSIPDSLFSQREVHELHRTRALLMDLHRQCTILRQEHARAI